jgi:hypothetical protein
VSAHAEWGIKPPSLTTAPDRVAEVTSLHFDLAGLGSDSGLHHMFIPLWCKTPQAQASCNGPLAAVVRTADLVHMRQHGCVTDVTLLCWGWAARVWCVSRMVVGG